ncbi:MAG: VOC family protein [Haloferacaceae archaeon]
MAPDAIHTAVHVRDLDAMLDFYVEGVGLTKTRSFTFRGVENHYVGGDHGEIQFKYDPERSDPVEHGTGLDHLAVGVEDVDEAFASLVDSHDPTVEEAPMTVEPAGDARVAFVRDPEGYVCELVETG